MIINETRVIDKMIAKYEAEAKRCSEEITTESERFYRNGLNAGKAEVYREVIEDLKKLKER